MKVKLTAFSLLTVVATVLFAEETIEGKWYTASQLNTGKQVFENYCMECHGTEGQGLVDNWKQLQADGSYPPPPLNGTAHTWHHPVSTLLRTINDGGLPLGGKMPAFSDKLTEKEKIAVIARFQDWWPDEVYQGWIERGGLNN